MTTNQLGHHRRIAHLEALTKHEVAAYLMKCGHELGFWCIPEYEIYGASGVLRKIDVVWATRNDADADSIWTPVAAFEIEGHNVAPKSMAKNADSLAAIAKAGARFTTVVLFQVSPDGLPWCRKLKPDDDLRAARLMKRHLKAEISPSVITSLELPASIDDMAAKLRASAQIDQCMKSK